MLFFLSQVDDDFAVQDYRLQYRRHSSGHFEDAYVGPECEFMVLQIDPNMDYQFRVCARGDGRQEWSPWSVPQIGHTSLIPHGKPRPFCYGLTLEGEMFLWWDKERILVSCSRGGTLQCRGSRVSCMGVELLALIASVCHLSAEWNPGLEGYSLSSRRNIALRNDGPCQSVLYSKSATYFPGQTLTFR